MPTFQTRDLNKVTEDQLPDGIRANSITNIVASLPGSPSHNDRYVLSGGANDNKIADYNSYQASWALADPIDGQRLWVQSAQTEITYDSGTTNWVSYATNANAIQGVSVSTTAPSNNQAVIYNSAGTVYKPTSITQAMVTDLEAGQQRFSATAGQSLFTITSFTVPSNTDNLWWFRGGLMANDTDHYNMSGSTMKLINSNAAAGEILLARKVTG